MHQPKISLSAESALRIVTTAPITSESMLSVVKLDSGSSSSTLSAAEIADFGTALSALRRMFPRSPTVSCFVPSPLRS